MMDNDGQWCNSAKPTLLCICQAVMTGNRSYYIIQYTKGRKHYGRNVPAAQLEAYRTVSDVARSASARTHRRGELPRSTLTLGDVGRGELRRGLCT